MHSGSSPMPLNTGQKDIKFTNGKENIHIAHPANLYHCAFIFSNILHDPIFSWNIESDQTGFAQLACQVFISDDPDRVDLSRVNTWLKFDKEDTLCTFIVRNKP